MKKSGLVCFSVLVFLISTVHGSQVVPAAVSPGSERGVALVGQVCPTFSWTAVDWATGYKVAVFQAFGVQIPSFEEMAAGMVPVLNKEIAGRASSWTPSSEEQLNSGSLYVWYVQAADSSGQGTWSKGKLFMVEAGMLASLPEERVKKTLREKGIREDIITDVLKEMKTEGAGVMAGTADSKPQGKVGAQAYEGESNTFYGLGAGFSISSGSYSTFIGRSAGYSNTTGNTNTFLGYTAGYSNTTGSGNTFLGYYAGNANTTGFTNIFLGTSAGYSNTTGYSNTFLGYSAGYFNTTGSGNAFLGYYAGLTNATGNYNIFLGDYAGFSNTTGAYNTYLGYAAGHYNHTGAGNVFVGNSAGYNEIGSNKLYIANSNTNTPLIYGDFSSGILGVNGWLGVGTQSPLYPMEVKTSGRNSVLVVQRSDGGAMNFMNASLAYGQFGTGNGYPVRILVNSAWRMSLNLDNSLTMVNGASCTAGGVWTDASSRELKENVEDLGVAEAEEALRELVPVKYNYKADKEERHVGFIAEDVPELVASKDRKTMSPMNITGVLTKVAQEQAKTVKDLEKAVQEQRKTIADLQLRTAELEKRGRKAKYDY